MRFPVRASIVLLAVGIFAGFSLAAADDGPGDKPPAKQDGGPGGGGPNGGGPGGGGPGGREGRGGPGGGFHLIPRFAEEKLNLTDDQKTQIAELEKETKAKLEKILTPEQMKTLAEARPPRRGGPGGGPGGGAGGGPDSGKGGPGAGQGGPGGDQNQDRPPRPSN